MPIIGIDLGTTFSAISTIDDIGNPEILPSLENSRITPSAVFIGAEKNILVGETAINSGMIDKKRYISEVKKKMGDSDIVFDITSGGWIKSESDNDTKFTPAEISAFILGKLKNHGSDIKDVVITVPACFQERGNRATKEAAEIAGLNCLELINEPTAAILHYANLPGASLSGRVLVFDLGGGTFDVTIADVTGKNIEVITSRGDVNLGGTDFDLEICNMFKKKYESEKNSSLEIDNKLITQAERVKKILSTKDTASNVVDGPDGPLKIDISRDEFIKSISSYLEKIKMLLEECMDESKTDKSDISEILLVGGSTRIPEVVKLITDKLGKAPTKGVNVDEAVASGAAIKAALLSTDKLNSAQKRSIEDVSLEDVLNYYFGTLASIPDSTGKYATQNSIILHRDSKVPVEKTEKYMTLHDNQTIVDVSITQSSNKEDDPEFVDIIFNSSLDLPPNRPAGQEILVSYTYKGGTLSAKFTDTDSGKEKAIELNLTGATSSNKKNSSDDKDPFLDFNIED